MVMSRPTQAANAIGCSCTSWVPWGSQRPKIVSLNAAYSADVPSSIEPGAIAGTVLFVQAEAAGKGALGAGEYALAGVLPWLVWAVALLVMRRMADGEYHPAVFGPPLSPRRRRLAQAMVVVFLLLFVPVPLRPAL